MTDEEFDEQIRRGYWNLVVSIDGTVGQSRATPAQLQEESGLSLSEIKESTQRLVDVGLLIPIVEGEIPDEVAGMQEALDRGEDAGWLPTPLIKWREEGRLKKVEKATMLLLCYVVPDTDGILDFGGSSLSKVLIHELPEVKTPRQARRVIRRLVRRGWIKRQKGQYHFIM